MSWLFCGGVGVTVLPVVVDYFLRCAHREKIREDSYNYDVFSLKHTYGHRLPQSHVFRSSHQWRQKVIAFMLLPRYVYRCRLQQGLSRHQCLYRKYALVQTRADTSVGTDLRV
jgi:hypothetical protein